VHTALFSGRNEFDDEVRREAAAGSTLLFYAEDLRDVGGTTSAGASIPSE
jgi:hypothetical protein